MSRESYEPDRGDLSPEVVPPPNLEAMLTPDLRYSHFRSPKDFSANDGVITAGHHEEKDAGTTRQPKRSVTSHKLAFIALGVAITAVIVGGAVGGGLGSRLAQCRNDLQGARDNIGTNVSSPPVTTSTLFPSSSSTPTVQVTTSAPTTTSTAQLAFNYAPLPPDMVNTTKLDCPRLDNTTYPARQMDAAYFLRCGVFIWPNVPSAEDHQKNVVDMVAIIAYRYEDCIEACQNYNKLQKDIDSDLRCLSISFQTTMAWAASPGAGNCWLKNGTVPTDYAVSTEEKQYNRSTLISAIRVGSVDTQNT